MRYIKRYHPLTSTFLESFGEDPGGSTTCSSSFMEEVEDD
jgi:hypothetical protein